MFASWKNVLERAVILSNGPTLGIDQEVFVSATPAPSAKSGNSKNQEPNSKTAAEVGSSNLALGDSAPARPLESLESTMRNHILAALEQSAWVIDGPRGAAKILGLHPNTLRSRMKKLGIVRPYEGQP
jgi:formate hydrogenlyase transcriptional activator